MRRSLLTSFAISLFTLPLLAVEIPPGFELTTIATAGQAFDTVAIELAPDGDVYMATYKGLIRIRRNGTIFEMDSVYGGVYPGTAEEGLHNLVLDPDYADNKHIWIFYSYYATPEGPSIDRLSRFTNVDDTLADEVVVFESPLSHIPFHAGGCLTFTEDETIMIGLGDDGLATQTAQDPFDVRGSIVHINRDGSPAAGNPYLDGTLGDPRHWAGGFRNPYRCRLQPETGNLFVGDVGGGTWEEIDVVIPGANFGWAYVEGISPPAVADQTYPLHVYHHNGMNACVIGGDFAPANFHPDYAGNYFYSDHQHKVIYRMVLKDDSTVDYVEPFASDTGRLIDVEFFPDGSMWYSAHLSVGASIGRIAYVGGPNEQPVARATATPPSGIEPLEVSFDAGDSTDPDDDSLSYLWDFGDGNMSGSETPSNTYAAGVYSATVTVDDGNGLTDVSPPIRIVSGNRKPAAAVTAPVNFSNFDAGQTINYTGTATDPEDGSLPCSSFTWRVIFNYDDHNIPIQGPLQGDCGSSFVVPVTGVPPTTNSSYEIRLIASDSGMPLGPEAVLESERFVTIHPNTAQLTFNTAPLPDLAIELDHTPLTAPATVDSVVGFLRPVGAPPNLHTNGHTYSWSDWSDGGTEQHDVVTPATNTTITATFTCDVIVEADGLRLAKAAAGEVTLTWDPVSDICLTTDPEPYRIYAAPEAIPSAPPGEFPSDPAWTLAGTAALDSFTYSPAANDRFFLVVAVGTDDMDGAVGHYPTP